MRQFVESRHQQLLALFALESLVGVNRLVAADQLILYLDDIVDCL